MNVLHAQADSAWTSPSPAKVKAKKEKPAKATTTTTSPAASTSSDVKASKPAKAEKVKPAKDKAAASTGTETKTAKPVKEQKTKTAKDKPATSGNSSASKPMKTEAPKTFSVDKVGAADISKLKFGKKKKMGNLMMTKGYYFDAADYFQSAYGDKPKKWKLLYSIAAANLRSRNYVNAENWYAKLGQTKKGMKKFPQAKLEQGLALKAMGQYAVAIDTFHAFARKTYKNEIVEGMKRAAKREISGCEMVDTLSQHKAQYKVSLLNSNINTPYNDYAPYAGDLFGLSYTSQRGTDPYTLRQTGANKVMSKFYESKKFGGDWEAATLTSTDINNMPSAPSDMFMATDGKSMYYTQTIEDPTGRVISKIFVSENNGTGWSIGRPLNENINDALSSSKNPMAYTNAEGKEVLYFSSNKASGKGGYDVYYAIKGESGEFGRAKNAGAVNSPGDDVTPFFDAENHILYYSSNGQINIGGLDVFKAIQDADGSDWGAIENLGTVVNSSADDYYFRPAKNFGIGYFVSNRRGGNSLKCETCSDDIYSVRMVRGNVKVLGTVTEDINGVRSPAQSGLVEVFKTSDNSKIAESPINSGHFALDVDKENESIYLLSKKTDFEDAKVGLNIGDYKPESIITELLLKRTFTYVGTKLGTVYFAFNKWELQKDAPDTLNHVVFFMKQFPQYIVEIGGHTDIIGTDAVNDTIGLKRADAVNNYFQKNSEFKSFIKPENTVVKSYGKTHPIAPNNKPDGKDNPEGRALNRRVEFIVVGEIKK
jgi:outer membrane protein OmpA-like peptidoglycan-associated protein